MRKVVYTVEEQQKERERLIFETFAVNRTKESMSGGEKNVEETKMQYFLFLEDFVCPLVRHFHPVIQDLRLKHEQTKNTTMSVLQINPRRKDKSAVSTLLPTNLQR